MTRKGSDKYKFKIKEIHVNSDLLASKIKDIVKEHFDVMYHADIRQEEDRETFVESMEFELMSMHFNNELVLFKVIFDKRNNKRKDMDRGVFHLEIQYQQWNCINISKLKYVIKKINRSIANAVKW